METMEDFEKEEQHLCDKEAFDTLVGFTSLEYRISALAHCQDPLGAVSQLKMYLFQQVKKIAKIGRKNTKDCIHKVLDKYVST
ncbi:hypothetical protein ABVT39_016740 [Epinephelus coioides]